MIKFNIVLYHSDQKDFELFFKKNEVSFVKTSFCDYWLTVPDQKFEKVLKKLNEAGHKIYNVSVIKE